METNRNYERYNASGKWKRNGRWKNKNKNVDPKWKKKKTKIKKIILTENFKYRDSSYA